VTPRRGIGRAWLLALALLLAGCGDPQPRLSELAPGSTLLAFGDSLTHGTGAGRNASYPARLNASTGLRVINAGVPGEITAAGLTRLPALLEREQPALVILIHGGNDMLRKLDPAQSKENLRSMIGLIRETGAEAVLLGVPKPAVFGLSAAPIYLELAEEMQVPIDGNALAEILSDRSLKADPIHPNAEGYGQLAAAVRALLMAHGAIN